MVTQKWSQTLRELDIANQLFTAEDLELAMTHLAQVTEADRLRSLNLSGTRITPAALRFVSLENHNFCKLITVFKRTLHSSAFFD